MQPNTCNLTNQTSPLAPQAASALRLALRSEAHVLLHGSLAATTRRQYDRHQLYFIRFLALIQCLGLVWDMPFICGEALPMYCAWLCRSCNGDTVKTYMGGVRHYYLLNGHRNPLEGNFKVKTMIKAQQRARPGGGNVKLPITLDMLKIMVHYSDWNNPFEVACICAAIVAFFAFLRKSNITVKHNDWWDAHSIARRNISCDAANAVMWINLQMTKTRGHSTVDGLRIPIPRLEGSRVDPWTWWAQHQKLSPSTTQDIHAFAYRSNAAGALKPLQHSDFRSFVRAKLRIGCPALDISKYSHQSFRRGGASFAFASNVPELFIQAMGDWLSDSYKRYIEMDENIRLTVAKRFAAATALIG